MPATKQHGFTLIELSIVLVIIGLVVGGVMVGTTMVHQAQLRAMMRDVTDWNIALRTFKEKYGYFPGDFPYASSIWPDCYLPNVTWCNGNGNDRIADTGFGSEGRRAWQQLSDANMVQGKYSGNPPANASLDTDNPSAQINSNAHYHFTNNDSAVSNLELATYLTSSGNWWGAAISSQDALAIDTKLDNGMPRTGKITATNGSGITGCINGGTGTPTTPYFATTDITCLVVFLIEK